MPDNPNTDNPPIETEAWEIALKPYASYPDAAYDLARHLTAIKQHLPNEAAGSISSGKGVERSV